MLASAAKRAAAAALWGLRGLARHPTVVLALVLVATGLGAVAMNALVWQPRRHPAPLFAGKGGEKPVAPIPSLLPPLRPAVSPAPVTAAAPTPAVPAAPVAAAPTPSTPAKATAPGRDPIGAMIRSGEAAVNAPVKAGAPNRDPIGAMIRGEGGASPSKADLTRIAAAQRALTKLGYGPLKADGMAGSGTKQAIERFERERKIPVTGELNPRTVRALSAQAGIPIG